MRAIIVYLFSYLALTVYGGEVCPFIEGLGFIQFSLELLIFFAVIFIIRTFISKKVYKSKEEPPKYAFYIEFISFILIGISITIFNSIFHKFPLESGLKVFIGTMALGFFAGVEISLSKARNYFNFLKEKKFSIKHKEKYTSFIKKFSIVSFFITFLFMIIIILVIIKDLDWLVTLGESGIKNAKKYVVKEIVFLISVLSFLIINAIISYSKNLKIVFNNLTIALSNITNGNLDIHIPVLSNDEMGAIANHTNTMVEGLKEKNLIKSILGKTTSPEIAEILINQEKNGIELGGSRRELAILMADIRSFTSFAEKKSPEIAVNLLNNYFTQVVDAITKNNGILDKFIGDGCLALFGFKDIEKAASESVKTGLLIIKIAEKISETMDIPFKVGIGIHSGNVIAGIIGSKERLEYTVIGDTVNTTARIEEATKTLNHNLIISKSIYDNISEDLKMLDWKKTDNFTLRGKENKIELYGL
jgi:adenylate cyclase